MKESENKTIIYLTRRSRNLTFKQWLIDLFEDERGITSIKPLISFFGSLLIFTTMVINASTNGKFLPSDSLLNAVLAITAIGLGADSVDKFSKRKITYNNNDVLEDDKKEIENVDNKKDDIL